MPQIIQLIMTYLRDNNLYKTLAYLELETQQSLDQYTKELQFFRLLILEGSFNSAEQYLQPLKNRLNEQYPRALFELKKQQYFELIDQKPDVEILITLLRQIESLTTPEVYKNLCFFLTLPSIRDHQDYQNWSIEKGRFDCFEKIALILKQLGRTFKIDRYNSLSLQQVVDRYQIYQNAFNLNFEEEHDIVREARSRPSKIEESRTSYFINENDQSQVQEKKREKLAFHTRVKSNEFEVSQQSSSQFYNSNKRPKEEQVNIIIEKLHITENHEEPEETGQVSGIFNYRFDDMTQVGYITDSQPIRAATFSSDGELFAVGTNSKSLRIYSMKSLLDDTLQNEIPILIEKNNHHQGSIYCIDWSRNGKFIATGSGDRAVKLFNYEEDIDFSLIGHKGIVRSVCFTDDTKLLSGGQDTIIKIWDIETQKTVRNLEGHTQSIYCIQAGGDGSYQVSVGQDRTLRIWDQRTSKAQAVLTMNSEINYVTLSESSNHQNLQNLVKGSKKAPQFSSLSLAALAHQDGSVSVWNLSQQKQITTLKHHTMDCRCVEFDPTARYLASVSFDQTITIYDWDNQKLVTQINEHQDKVVLCKWHPFYPFILSTSADSTARIFAPNGFLNQLIKSYNFAQ